MAPVGDDPTQLAFTVDTGDLETGFKKAGAQLEQFKTAVNSGKGNFVGLGAAVSQTIETIEERLRAMAAAGKGATDAEVAQLQKLKTELEANVAQAGNAAAAKQKFSDKMRVATLQAGEFKGSVFSATDALKNMAPELAGRIQGLSVIAAKFLLAAQAAKLISGAARELFVDGTASGKEWDEQLTSLDKTISSIFSLDVVGVVKNFGTFVGETFNNITDATQTLTEVNEGAAASYDLLGSKGSDAVERLRGILAITRELINERQNEAKGLDDRAAALARIATSEMESGSASEFTRRQIKQTADAYKEEKKEVLPELQAIIDKLGIQSSAQEDAAKKAEDKAKRHADAVRTEVDALEGSLETLQERTRLHLEAVAAVERDGVVTAATADAIQAKNAELAAAWKRYGAEVPESLQSVIDQYADLATAATAGEGAAKTAIEATTGALREQISELESRAKLTADQAAQAEKSLADAEARRQELSGRPLSLEESDELMRLEADLGRARQEQAEKSRAAAAAAAELEARQIDLAQSTGASSAAVAKNAKALAELEGIEVALAAGRISYNDAVKARYAILKDAEAATAGLAEATYEAAKAGEDFGGAYREANRVIETFGVEQGKAVVNAERFGETFVRTMEDGSTQITNFVGEIGLLQGGLEEAGEAGEKALGGVADEAERAADNVQQIRDGTEGQVERIDAIAEAWKRVRAVVAEVKDDYRELDALADAHAKTVDDGSAGEAPPVISGAN